MLRLLFSLEIMENLESMKRRRVTCPNLACSLSRQIQIWSSVAKKLYERFTRTLIRLRPTSSASSKVPIHTSDKHLRTVTTSLQTFF